MQTFEQLESSVRSYCRLFPTIFTKAKGSYLIDEHGKKYLDFLCGAGSLNYGHNNPALKKALINYIKKDGITHSLDLYTEAKKEFIKTFRKYILQPRELKYKIQFTGPTGSDAVEASLKIARKVTGRKNIVYFSRAYHGVTLGSLALNGNPQYRSSAGITLKNAIELSFEARLRQIENLFSSKDTTRRPAAVILETIQGEGGINEASPEWLRGLEKLCRRHRVLLIVDDIQTGCGRTGKFFSFEDSGIKPDIVTLSKSISGYGLPMSLVLIKPEYDVWKPGEHCGTFRGNNHAFVTAKAAIEKYWRNKVLEINVRANGKYIATRLKKIVRKYPSHNWSIRGRGLFLGLDCISGKLAGELSKEAFKQGIVCECCGTDNQVLKIFSPLTISRQDMEKGMDILENSIDSIMKSRA